VVAAKRRLDVDTQRPLALDRRRQLAQVTGTLSNTAAVFGPMVGGATVALSATMQSGGPIESVPTASLGPVIGWYCLVLAAVLPALSTGLHRGLDHPARLDDEEVAAFRAAHDAEESALGAFRLRALGALVALYFCLLMVYALV